jgi:pyridoxal/pyridoxine/pyridoxamine kinase
MSTFGHLWPEMPVRIGREQRRLRIMADFVVDYSLLEQVDKTLKDLAGQFQNIQTQEQGYTPFYGSGDIAGAMDDFAGNWSYHRGKIVDSMNSLSSSVEEVMTETKKFDSDMTKQLTPQ